MVAGDSLDGIANRGCCIATTAARSSAGSIGDAELQQHVACESTNKTLYDVRPLCVLWQ